MSSPTTNSSVTIGGSFTQLLTIAFVILKLTHQIDWSWWWVLSPLWIPLAILLAVVLFFVILGAFFSR